jgi:PAS domain S-box-containing protein
VLVPLPRSVMDYWLVMLLVIPVSSVMGVHAHGRFLHQLEAVNTGARRLEDELSARQRSEARMRATLENTPNVAIQWYDSDGRVLYWNRASESLFGWSARDAAGVHLGELFMSPDEADAAIELMRGLEPGAGCHGPEEFRVRRRDGGTRWVSSTIFAIPGNSGVPSYVCMDVDVTERKRTEAALTARNESLRLLSELSSRVYAVSDIPSILRAAIDVVRAVTRASGVLTYLIERDGTHLQLVAQQGLDDEYARIAARVKLSESWSRHGIEQRRPLVTQDIRAEPDFNPAIRTALTERGLGSGIVMPLLDNDTPLGCIALFYPPGAISGSGQVEMETFEAVSRTLSMAIANARRLEQLRHQACHDSLTGLPNRIALHEEFARLTLGGGARPSMMLLDLDRFKDVNDTLGHHIGDQLLCALSQRLSETVGFAEALTCRLGGDEFAVLLHDAGSAEQALARASAIREALVRPFDVDAGARAAGAARPPVLP